MPDAKHTEAADESLMRLALEEARKGLWLTSPNPAVGAVIAKDGKVLAKGWHRRAGEPHAEIEAIRALAEPELARGAELFVTLEPCSTMGKTPPCTDAIVQSGFARVVYGATDPNPAHRGRAAEILSKAGILVRSGVLPSECQALNREWEHWITTKTPWVILKAGMSLDGRIVPPPGEGSWVTSQEAREDAMILRARADAILVGGETLRADRPRLTLRGKLADSYRQPVRVVWTRDPVNLPADAPPLCDDFSQSTIVSTAGSFPELLQELGERNLATVLLEGGGAVHGAALDSGCVQEVVLYIAPKIFGGGVPAIRGLGAGSNEEGLRLLHPRYSRVGPDLKIEALVDKPRQLAK